MQKNFAWKRWSVARMGWWTALGGGEVVPGGCLSFGRRPLELETDNHHEENHDGGSFCWRGDRDGPDYCDYLKLDVMVLELEMEGKLQLP